MGRGEEGGGRRKVSNHEDTQYISPLHAICAGVRTYRPQASGHGTNVVVIVS